MQREAVTFRSVAKRFRLGDSHTALGSFRDLFRRRSGNQENPHEFWALRDVGFDIRRGEAFGIIGPNGSGKSTILKLLAGILRPDEGEIRVQGRLAGLLEVGAGFHGELTGRENIFLNGCILGMSRSDIRSKLDAIVAFSGLERFLDMPVKRYSSGMYARLGFSVAVHTEPDVLLVDEVLSVGDAVFRMRCFDRMRELTRRGTTLVFVTHDLEQMGSICERALVLDGGRMAYQGPANEAMSHYLRAMTSAANRPPDLVAGPDETSQAVDEVELRFVNGEGDDGYTVSATDPLRIELSFRIRIPVATLVVEVNARTAHGQHLLSLNTGRSGWSPRTQPGLNQIHLTLPAIPLAGGEYFWNVRLWDAERGTSIIDTPFRFPMLLRNDAVGTGALSLEHTWANVGVENSERSAFEGPSFMESKEGEPATIFGERIPALSCVNGGGPRQR